MRVGTVKAFATIITALDLLVAFTLITKQLLLENARIHNYTVLFSDGLLSIFGTTLEASSLLFVIVHVATAS